MCAILCACASVNVTVYIGWSWNSQTNKMHVKRIICWQTTSTTSTSHRSYGGSIMGLVCWGLQRITHSSPPIQIFHSFTNTYVLWVGRHSWETQLWPPGSCSSHVTVKHFLKMFILYAVKKKSSGKIYFCWQENITEWQTFLFVSVSVIQINLM